MTETIVNIPLLRKAVEWAEAEAAKPWELCEWNQQAVVSAPELLTSYYDERGNEIHANKAPECGTCYCIAGFIAANTLGSNETMNRGWSIYADGAYVCGSTDRAAELIGIDSESALDDGGLFAGGNTIEQVRVIAETLAGERL